MKKIIRMSIKNKDGSVSVRAEDLKDFADTQKAINEGKRPQRTPDELAAMKAQVLTRTDRQKNEKLKSLSDNSDEEKRAAMRQQMNKVAKEAREWGIEFRKLLNQDRQED